MSITVEQLRKESHALALYLLLCSDSNDDALNSFLASGGEIDRASAVFYGIDPTVFSQAWQEISPTPTVHTAPIKAFLSTFKPLSVAVTGFGYPADADACPTGKTVGKLLS